MCSFLARPAARPSARPPCRPPVARTPTCTPERLHASLPENKCPPTCPHAHVPTCSYAHACTHARTQIAFLVGWSIYIQVGRGNHDAHFKVRIASCGYVAHLCSHMCMLHVCVRGCVPVLECMCLCMCVLCLHTRRACVSAWMG